MHMKSPIGNGEVSPGLDFERSGREGGDGEGIPKMKATDRGGLLTS